MERSARKKGTRGKSKVSSQFRDPNAKLRSNIPTRLEEENEENEVKVERGRMGENEPSFLPFKLRFQITMCPLVAAVAIRFECDSFGFHFTSFELYNILTRPKRIFNTSASVSVEKIFNTSLPATTTCDMLGFEDMAAIEAPALIVQGVAPEVKRACVVTAEEVGGAYSPSSAPVDDSAPVELSITLYAATATDQFKTGRYTCANQDQNDAHKFTSQPNAGASFFP